MQDTGLQGVVPTEIFSIPQIETVWEHILIPNLCHCRTILFNSDAIMNIITGY